jgi:hypothetical protein
MTDCGVVELRRYTLHPGERDTLIGLFEREFVEPQEAVGAHVLATWIDLDDPDAFVWLRGFRDMDTRARALKAFYGGPVWGEHREAANKTMIDSDNVLLLRPDSVPLELGGTGPLALVTRFGAGFRDDPRAIARFRSEEAPNNYPGLPVREGVKAIVSLVRFGDAPERDRHVDGARSHGAEAFRVAPTRRSPLR